jgi:tRNA1Val (adenine37-N6)-methyltransferase
MAAGFTCKQFSVAHSDCAMKVGTDSLVLGAWSQLPTQGNILDIGCGSAILSLMLAQRTQSQQQIDAVELCQAAAAQAQDNARNSPWAERIRVVQADILTYPDSADHLGQRRYALIISNPPYFQHSLKNPSQQKQQARHTDSLPFADLLQVAGRLAAVDGLFSLILPVPEAMQLQSLANGAGWYLVRSCALYAEPDKPVGRLLMTFSRQQHCEQSLLESLVVRDHSGAYSAQYRSLLRDFYLKF